MFSSELPVQPVEVFQETTLIGYYPFKEKYGQFDMAINRYNLFVDYIKETLQNYKYNPIKKCL